MEDAGGELREIRLAVNSITAHFLTKANCEGSVLTTYADDDKGCMERVPARAHPRLVLQSSIYGSIRL